MGSSEASPAERLPLAVGAGMFGTAAALLVLQIALTRLLSATVHYHYAFLVIAVVMLALSASAIAAFRHKVEGGKAAMIPRMGLLGAVATALAPLSYLYLGPLGGDGFRIAIAIGTFYGTFWLCGYVISALLDRHQAVVGRLYWTDLLGASIGCLGAIALLDRLSAQDVMLACALVLAVASGALATVHGTVLERRAALAVVAATGLLFGASQLTELTRLRQARGEDQTKVLWESWNSLARVSVSREMGGIDQAVVLAGYDPAERGEEVERLARLWQAGWGMSRLYDGEVPEIRWIALDAGAGTQIVRDGYAGAVARELEFLEWDVTASAHHLRRDAIERSLVIGGGGGRDVLTALQYGAEHVDVIELNPGVVWAVEEATRDFSGGVYHQPRVSLEIGEGRSVLTRRSQRYDLLQMSMVDTFASSASGALSLSENGLYTQEAFELLLRHVDDDGLLSMSRWLSPIYWQETARTVTMLGAAMRSVGIDDPAAHFAMLHVEGYLGTGVSTCIVSRQPFRPEEREALAALAHDRGYTLMWPVAGEPEPIGPFAIPDLLRGDPAVAAHPVYDLVPATDERPFFFNFSRLFGSWAWAVRTGDATVGSPVLSQMLVALSGLLAMALVGIARPLRRLQEGAGVRTPGTPSIVWFAGIGFGFMLCELALIQRFMVFLGHPTRGLSVVLASLLLASGVGSLLSSRMRDDALGAWVHRSVLAVMVLQVAAAFGLPPALAAAIGLPDLARIALTAVLVAPLGLALGTCFPLGVRLVRRAGESELVPVLWGINGLFGVAGSVVGMTLAMSWGYTAVFLASVAAYAATAWAGRLLVAGPSEVVSPAARAEAPPAPAP